MASISAATPCASLRALAILDSSAATSWASACVALTASATPAAISAVPVTARAWRLSEVRLILLRAYGVS